MIWNKGFYKKKLNRTCDVILVKFPFVDLDKLEYIKKHLIQIVTVFV